MKRDQRFSKPFLVMAGGAVALIVFFLWFGLSHRNGRSQPKPLPQLATTSQLATNVVSTVAALPAPSPQSVTNGASPPVIPIPLANVLTGAENASWLKDENYLLVPHKPQKFGGIEFLMDGMIQLQGQVSKKYKNFNYRTAIAIPLSLTNAIGSIHLLGGTRYGGGDGQTFAEMVWHYTDGSSSRTPIQYLVHIRDWVRNPYEQPAHLPYRFSKVVWSVPMPSRPGCALRLYRVTFPNPEPRKMIKELELVSKMEDTTLFIVGVTLDPLKPGERPDNTPDLEPTDETTPDKIQIVVQNPEGLPLPQSKLQIQLQQRNGTHQYRSSLSAKTDNNGVAEVAYPPQHLDRLTISASHDGYAGREMIWDLRGGEVVPASYTLKLTAGVKIGGTVVDENDSPIAGAKISLYRFWTGGEDFNKSGEQTDFPSQAVTSDASGNWHAKGLPPGLLDHIGFEVTHPDYIGTNYTVGGGPGEAQLRAGTLKTVLRQGLEARGLVLDDNDNAVSGAKVWAGRRFFRNRQQTKSDAQGRFTFHNVSGGEVLFSVMAKGLSPANKTVNVHSNMDEILFRLKPGNTIRAHVQNEASDPILGARIALEGQPGEAAYDAYQFSATTDDQGNFTWDSAPNKPMPFYIYHSGYEAKRGVKLAPNQDNTVTLRHCRQLQGVVLDATSEQPVTKFSIRMGHHNPNDTDVYGVLDIRDFNAPDGKFTMDIGEEADNAIAVSADGYADKIESFPEAQNGIVKLTIYLKPSASLAGIVIAPDGTPVPGANVAVASDSPRASFQLAGAHLRSFNWRTKVATTDADGRFEIPSTPDNGTVVAAGDPGFAEVSVAQVRGSGTILLQQWGRIEGTLKIAGVPAAGKDLMIDLNLPGVTTDWNSYKRTTDNQGAFNFENVPAGKVLIVRLIPTAPNMWTHSYQTNVQIEPGQTTYVTLGDSGAVVIGSVSFEAPPADEGSLYISGNLSSPMPSMPGFNSPDEARAFFNSPAWKERMSEHKDFAFAVGADKTFTVDSVPPGKYNLTVSATKKSEQPWMQKPVAQGQTVVTVPEDANPYSPISVGQILLKPITQQ